MAEESLNPAVMSAVSNSNFKNVAEAPAFYASMGMANAVAHQNRLNILAESALNQALKGQNELDPVESLGLVKGLTGNDLAKQIADLSAVIASIQQQMKGANTTPPVTP